MGRQSYTHSVSLFLDHISESLKLRLMVIHWSFSLAKSGSGINSLSLPRDLGTAATTKLLDDFDMTFLQVTHGALFSKDFDLMRILIPSLNSPRHCRL